MIIDIPPVYEQYIQQLASNQGLSVADYMLSLLPTPDTTEYLLASPTNAERLTRAIAQARQGRVQQHELIEL
ncbi:MAG: hypothetical protein Q4D05_08315 [Acinetobacter sp.]|nr:hypothetical protein [Acinetobacter sp.]